ncbi:MAG TPA: bifunctional biotin--[acetyl-CoA-carboxylase] ligase/biotin operon repressor BirA [Gammaproteobacteria bacterium]|nr:bifunctional biotin--[acetyl-CoA-carboxylase] ligase/biotin operon repressor BirA [Gammaproteobacteria bacterium]
MAQTNSLLSTLADGRFHSGEDLGAALGVSRAAVWKQIKALERQLGLTVHSVPGRGYRLASPLELLEHEAIVASLPAPVRDKLAALEIHFSLDSTNRYLMQRAAEGAPGGMACLAERQEAGRGRHGRRWVSPFGTNLYMSVLWRSRLGPAQLGGLSLAVGAAVAEGLAALGVADIGLKWPNDLVWAERKLGGVLLEVVGESNGPCHVVAGVGLNLAMDAGAAVEIDQPWVDLREVAGQALSRNAIAAAVLAELLPALDAFAEDGLGPSLSAWRERDALFGQPVRLTLGEQVVEGVARGVDEDGCLLIDGPTGLQRFSVGEASLRRREERAVESPGPAA